MMRWDYRIVFAWGLTPLRRKMMVNFIRSIHVTSVLAHRFCMGLTPLRRNMMIKIDGTLILASRAWFSGAMVIFSGFVYNLIFGRASYMVSSRCLLRCHNVARFCMVQTPLRRNMMVNFMGSIFARLTCFITFRASYVVYSLRLLRSL